MASYKRKERAGFVLYHDLYEDFCEMSDEESGQLVKAALSYSIFGEVTDFQDRAVKSLYRKIAAGIDRSRDAWEEKCIKAAYSRYKGICRGKSEEALSFEEWAEVNQSDMTMVDERQPCMTVVDNLESELELVLEDNPEPVTRTKLKPDNENRIVGGGLEGGRNCASRYPALQPTASNVIRFLREHGCTLNDAQKLYSKLFAEKKLHDNWEAEAVSLISREEMYY